VYFVSSPEEKELIRGAFYDQGLVWLTTTHFSYYAIIFDKQVDEFDWLLCLVAILLMIIVVLLILLFRWRLHNIIVVNAVVEKDEVVGEDKAHTGPRDLTKFNPIRWHRAEEPKSEEPKDSFAPMSPVVKQDDPDDDEDDEDDDPYTASIHVK
jgi:hypothetical protein